jgi:hypothetical protein
LALGWLEMIELDWLSAGSRLAGDDRAGLAFGWLEMIELDRISAGSRLAG